MSSQAILLDIEGATTSIRFVYDTLFPFARRHVATFLESAWGEAAVQLDVEALRAQAERDHADGVTGAPPIPSQGPAATVRAATLANVLWQMDADRKTTGLKGLQGKIWRHGYTSGVLQGHIYDDVEPALRDWHAASVPVYIYSSGSVAAQKLLFHHSERGDLTPLLAGYFDTTTGPKKEASSYAAIAEAIHCDEHEVLFVTDNLDEAIAADSAGLDAVLSIRPGNAPLREHNFRTITSFDEIAR
jgi:2,3-diketo-5-methylthio-1-phosphopentane phosphatase